MISAIALFAVAAALQAPTAPEEQARRLLEDGKGYYAQGKFKQALDNFNTIVSGFPTTDSVDDALLEIGRYHLEIEGEADKARQAFEEVTKRFPQSDGAPGAYYYLGRLALSRAVTDADLDDALANFTRVERLYPRSDWVPKALHASGLAHRKAGRFADAVAALRRVTLEYPSSEPAAAAQFQIAHCLGLLGEPRPAMEAYQQVRNRFPESEWAPRALERITALYRLYGSAAPSFTLDNAFSVGAGDVLKDVRGLLVAPDHTLWIASEKAKAAVPFDRDGHMGSSLGAEEPRGLFLSARGEVSVTNRLAVRMGAKDLRSFSVPGDKSAALEPLEHIAAALVTRGGNLLVSDDKRNRVFRFDAQSRYLGPFPDAKERTVTRMAGDGEGGIAFLDREERTVRVFDEAGHALRSVGPKGSGFELRRPVDVALDSVRNLYVADEEMGVFIISPEGRLLATLTGESLRRPKALALDPSGALLVYDDKSGKIVRFR